MTRSVALRAYYTVADSPSFLFVRSFFFGWRGSFLTSASLYTLGMGSHCRPNPPAHSVALAANAFILY